MVLFFLHLCVIFRKIAGRFNFKQGETIMSNKWVYTFGNGAAEGKADMRNLLGGKGANLAEMNLVGLPVPAGFTVTTEGS